MTLYYDLFPSPIGRLAAVASNEGLLAIVFTADGELPDLRDSLPRRFGDAKLEHAPSRVSPAIHWLRRYFDGDDVCMADLAMPITAAGTPFQRKVWKALEEIPYGHTASYGDIARKLGVPGSSRAVGSANNRNLLPLLRPCHRVIGSDGRMTGYAGGVWRKEFLLGMEGYNASPAAKDRPKAAAART